MDLKVIYIYIQKVNEFIKTSYCRYVQCLITLKTNPKKIKFKA